MHISGIYTYIYIQCINIYTKPSTSIYVYIHGGTKLKISSEGICFNIFSNMSG